MNRGRSLRSWHGVVVGPSLTLIERNTSMWCATGVRASCQDRRLEQQALFSWFAIEPIWFQGCPLCEK